jgi:hypothetical protein
MQKTVELHTTMVEEMRAVAGEEGFTSMCVSLRIGQMAYRFVGSPVLMIYGVP